MATTDKIRKDIAKTKEKISQLQTKLRTLETQLTEEENLEIVRMVKAVKMDNRELTAFLRAYASGQIVLPEEMRAVPEQEDDTDMLLASAAMFLALSSVSNTCMFMIYQPDVPEELK